TVRDRTVTPRCLGCGDWTGWLSVEEQCRRWWLSYKNIYIYLHGDYKPQHTAHKRNKQMIRHKYRHPLQAQARPKLGPGTQPEAKYITSRTNQTKQNKTSTQKQAQYTRHKDKAQRHRVHTTRHKNTFTSHQGSIFISIPLCPCSHA